VSQPIAVPGYGDLAQVAGSGAGVVYRARSGSGRVVALKVLLLADPAATERFDREVEITATLGRQHPNIVTVLDSGTTADGHPYLAMEYAEHGSLHDRLRAAGPLPVPEVVAVGVAVADALEFAHGHGVVHGDVKPQNILAHGDRAVLADFGLARRVVADLGAGVGGDGAVADRFSYRHAAPQVLDGEPLTVAADVYSLGSTLYTLLDGRPPFAADDPAADTALGYLRRARTGRSRPLRRPDLPPDLVTIVERCLARDPADRYASAAAVRDALAAVGADRATPGAAAWEPAGAVPGDVPRQLPADVPGFTGRAGPLAVLDSLPAGSVVATITGTPGVGKTALAVHWAHQVAARFPDGQLFVNLRGYDPGLPADPVEVLARLLRGLSVPAHQIPTDRDERAALYRSVLAGRRALIVLDNASDAAQVRPLLPGAPGCLVLVTGRGGLAGLVARDGARQLTLGVLTPVESAVLLDRVLGDSRTATEPEAAREIAALCGHLPVALRVAAANLADRPQQTLAAYAGTLRSGNRLNLLRVDGDDEAALRATFDLSYQRLDPPARRLFRLLGTHPGHDVSAHVAAALAGEPVEQVRPMLGALTGAYLVQPSGPDRYALHDLLRAYARDLAAAESRPALRRMLDFYLYASEAAVRLARPYARGLPLSLQRPATGVPDLGDFAAAVAFLEAEQPNLVATVRHAAAHGFDTAAWQLPHLLWRYFELRGYLEDWLGTARLALAAATRLDDLPGTAVSLHALAVAHRRMLRSAEAIDYDERALAIQRDLGDAKGQATTLTSIGITYSNVGRFAEGRQALRAAVELCREAADTWGEASALGNLGTVYRRLGDYPRAAEHLSQGLALFRRLGDRRNEAGMLGNLGLLYRGLGDYAAAAAHMRPSIELYAQVGDPLNEAGALGNLGTLYERLGRLDEAADQLRQARVLFQRIGDRRGEAEVLGNLGAVHQRLGRHAEAVQHHRAALALLRATGDDRGLETEVRNDLGAAHHALGQDTDAVDQHREALALARASGSRYEQARAHEGIARASGDTDHLHRALAIYTELGVPEADELRATLGQPV
jgi:tetratricopeptide (TPR) repeat protein